MSQGPEQQSITEAAAEWAVRLHAGALSEEAQAQLEQWLAADKRHPEALRFAEQTWAALGDLALEPACSPSPATSRSPTHAGEPTSTAVALGRACGSAVVGSRSWLV